METTDAVVIGAGVIGAACAYYLTRAGLGVTVLERSSIASGTTSAGEGNLLISDKDVGPELDLALLSARLWRGELEEIAALCEFEPKGGLVVAPSDAGERYLRRLSARQAQAGVQAVLLSSDELTTLEPHLSPAIRFGALYPQDSQVQPMLLTAHLLVVPRRVV